MSKVLKPYTIVPSNLYVERSADRQVESIITEMGRPGYVLVSRQMGKTNLLLNARRKYSNHNDRFVYVDLSNIFDNELSCFRNIIDTAIETNLEVLAGIDLEIENFRSKFSELPPHKQHERELRMLLSKIDGKLIIILDEIDALTKTDYSDRIFAQIRSIYFARVNFEEFNRLTYLLSGVVEPSELIKDPKISPFNIGEKIFLNDFSYDEFQEFAKKSGLNGLSDSIKERVYYWANGNPRLTWDIFSVIEEIITDIKSEEDVDAIVKKHYLTSFDKPPVDNIREIVKNDKSLRDALIEIDYGKGDLITDEIKRKLYLAGIINLDDKNITVKNRIIRLSLSNSWIESLGDGVIDFLHKGIDFYSKSAFKPAIENLLKSINSLQLNETEVNLSRLYLGLSYYYDNELDKAKEYLLSVSLSPKEYGKLYSLLNLHLGYIYLIDNEIDNAKKTLKKVVEIGVLNDVYLSAKINLIQLFLSSEDKFEIEYAKELIGEILETDIKAFSLEDSGIFYEVKFVIGILIAEKGLLNYNEAQKNSYFEGLIDKLSTKLKTNLFLSIYKYSNGSTAESKKYLDLATENVLTNELKVRVPKHDFDVCFSIDQLRELELLLFIEDKRDQFKNLIEYEVKARRTSEEKILDKLMGFAQEKNFGDNIIFQLGEYFYETTPPKDENIKKNLLTLLGNYSYRFESAYKRKYAIELLEYILQNESDDLDIEMTTLLMITVDQLLQANEMDKANYFIQRSYEVINRLPEELKDTFLIINFFDLIYMKKIGQLNNAKQKASEILELTKSTRAERSKNPLINNNLTGIINECNLTLNQSRNRSPIIRQKKPGRNDTVTVKYKNGETKRTKYKNVESDVDTGLCIII